MKTNNSELNELSEKILRGVAKASRKLVEESAAKGKSLVVSINGEVRKVPARELLLEVAEKA